MEMRCPGCQGRSVGKVGTGQYYCWDCFIEFAVSARGLRLYRVEADGELSRLEADVEGVPPTGVALPC
jgi:ribosomal protein L37AE/L43A